MFPELVLCVETETFFLTNLDTMITSLIVVDVSMGNRFQGNVYVVTHPWVSRYRSGTVNSKSFVGKVLLRIKQKFELTYPL